MRSSAGAGELLFFILSVIFIVNKNVLHFQVLHFSLSNVQVDTEALILQSNLFV